MRQEAIKPEFVDRFPAELIDGVLYISMTYGTAAHKCCCGCGRKVITPFGRTDWKLLYDGESVSLHPSIGNWSFPCQSHYWIRDNAVRWAPRWTKRQIRAGRARDRQAKEIHFSELAEHDRSTTGTEDGAWSKLRRWFGG